MSVNKVILIGNVGRAPEVRYLDNGVAVATLTLATSERGYTLQNGTQVPERTEWHNIVAWRGLAELAEKYKQIRVCSPKGFIVIAAIGAGTVVGGIFRCMLLGGIHIHVKNPVGNGDVHIQTS